MSAGVEMGYENRDGNGEFQTGFMIPQVQLKEKASMAYDFLLPFSPLHMFMGLKEIILLLQINLT